MRKYAQDSAKFNFKTIWDTGELIMILSNFIIFFSYPFGP